MTRAQTTLPVLGVALVLITAVSVIAVQTGTGSIERASAPSMDRASAIALSDRLVSNHSTLTVRPNVVNRSRFGDVDEEYLRGELAIRETAAVRLRVGNRSLVETGDVSAGSSFERIVLVRSRQSRERRPRIVAGAAVTIPRRVSAVNITLDSAASTSIRAVLAGDEIVLSDDSGLTGPYRLDLSRFETTQLTIDTIGPLDRGDVVLRYDAPRTRKAILEVTVDG